MSRLETLCYGSFSDVSPERLFTTLGGAHATGVLSVWKSGLKLRLYLHRGGIVQGVSSDPEYGFRKFLVNRNLVRPSALKREVPEDTPPVAVAPTLVKKGLVDKDKMIDALQEFFLVLVYRICLEDRAPFQFESQSVVPEGRKPSLAVPLLTAVIKAISRMNPTTLERKVGSLDVVVAKHPAMKESIWTRLGIEQRQLLDAVDGRRTIRDVTGDLQLDTTSLMQAMFSLMVAGLVVTMDPDDVSRSVTKRRGKKIVLIVEDDNTVREAMVRFFREKEFEVLEAPEAHTALNLARENQPDVVITDIVMPRIDGFLFCEIMTSDPRTKDIPIIIVSALDSEGDVERAHEIGVDNYITKPFKFAELYGAVRRVLESG